MNKILDIEVVYANAEKQQVTHFRIAEGSTIEAAILCSGILQIFPEIDLTKQKVGVFSKPRSLHDLVAAGDRIEIYRPLLIDPKEGRRAKGFKKISC